MVSTRFLIVLYRAGFAPMYRQLDGDPPSYVKLTSDAGWGCMIRVGQMMLLAALKRHILYHPIPITDSILSSTEYDYNMRELKLLEHFLDVPNFDKHPFSIFAFIRVAGGWIETPASGAEKRALDAKLTSFR